MARAVSPYGDGHAAERIAGILAGEAERIDGEQAVGLEQG
jgi:UDP-N-acetylglucosamine 2-epimerase